jgi:hypothetical protein
VNRLSSAYRSWHNHAASRCRLDGQSIFPKKHPDQIRLYDAPGGKRISNKSYSLTYCTVRQESGNYLKIDDGYRQAWVMKNQFTLLKNAVA